MSKQDKDYLDELVEAECARDPKFAAEWKAIEAASELTAMRVKKGLTQQDVADTMGVKRERMSEIEKNPLRVSFRRLALYAYAVGAEIQIVPLGAGESETAAIPPQTK